MNSSGIFRRVDELGRIVLPRELRKSMKIDVGQKLEISINDESDIVLHKMSELKDKTEYDRVVIALSHVIEQDILITDREKVIASSNKDYLDKELTAEAYDIIRRNDTVVKKKVDGSIIIPVTKDEEKNYDCQLFVPVLRDSDSIGSIIVLCKEGKFSADNVKLCKAFATLLSMIE